jgi:hypothetical protein
MSGAADIPWDKLGIPAALRGACAPDAPRPLRLAAARLALPADAAAALAALYVLTGDSDAEVRDAAIASVRSMPGIGDALSQRTHPKVLEVVAQLRPERALDEKISVIRNANDRTLLLIAERADAAMCGMLADNHERLLITPEIARVLNGNPACTDAVLERAVGFLRMNDVPVALPPRGTPASTPAAGAVAAPATPASVPFDLEAEIEAALSGQASPMLEAQRNLQMFDLDRIAQQGPLAGFTFDYDDDLDFSGDMTEDSDEELSDSKKLSLEQKIANMPVGKKIKLAYLGNKEARAILIRDRNKQVALAVIKGGRMSENEALSFAGNRSLASDVLREIAANREWMRLYPLKVALANNPKCPPSIAVGIVNVMSVKDLSSLARNKNVSSVVFTLAHKMLKTKQMG